MLTVSGLISSCSSGEETTPDETVTYQRDIRPLYQESCVGCHREGGIGPFRLDSYDAAKANATASMLATAARIMPPWSVDNSGDCQTYQHSRELSDEQIDLVARWVAGGMVEGDPADAPAPSGTDELTGDLLGATMPELYTPAPNSIGDDDRCFLLDAPIPNDGFVTAFEVVPGNAAIVHHLLVFTAGPDQQDAIAALDAETPEPGWPCFGSAGDGIATSGLAAIWTPGVRVSRYPEGTGLTVHGGDLLIMQVHYYAPTPKGSDRTSIRMQLADQVGKSAVILLLDGLIGTAASGQPFVIPPGEADVRFTWDTTSEGPPMGDGDEPPTGPPGGGGGGAFDAPIDLSKPYQVHGVFPHMHLIGHTFEAMLAGETCATRIVDYDFDWQEMYFYENALTVQPGQSFQVTCGYDSRARTEPTDPGFGAEQEMCSYILYATQ